MYVKQALDTMNLSEVDQLRKPDFMSNPHKYFTERTGSADSHSVRLPALAESKSYGFIQLVSATLISGIPFQTVKCIVK